MTLILSIRCSDGVIIGADSASTDAECGIRQPTKKLSQIGRLPLVFGGSGDVGLMQKIIPDFASITAIPPTSKNLRKSLKKLIMPELAEAANGYVRQPGQPINSPVAVFLFAAIVNREPTIIEVDQFATDTSYESMKMGGFYAIGSGKLLAMALMRTHLFSERTLGTGKVLAYRVLKDAISMDGRYLAEPIHLYTIDLGGTVTELTEHDLRGLNDTCEMWRNLERDCLGKAIAPASAPTSDLLVPSPPVPPAAPAGAGAPAQAPAR